MRPKKISDPVRLDEDNELYRRHRCVWIDEHRNARWWHRCPRPEWTGQECWCRLSNPRVEGKWPWRVVPPLKDPKK